MSKQKLESGELVKRGSEISSRFLSKIKERILFTLEIIKQIQQDSKKDKKNLKLVMKLIDDIKKGVNQNKSDKNDLTVQDTYYIPENISTQDNDLYKLLCGILGKYNDSNRDINENYIKEHHLPRLNYILNLTLIETIKHLEKESSVNSGDAFKIYFGDNNEDTFTIEGNPTGAGSFIKRFEKRLNIQREGDKIRKISFNIDDWSKFKEFARYLLTGEKSGEKKEVTEKQDNEEGHLTEDERNTLILQKHGLFLKNLIVISNIENNDIYKNREEYFGIIIKNIFGDFLHFDAQKKENIKLDTKKGDNGENMYFTDFSFDYLGRNINGKFLFCTKSLESLLKKIRRSNRYPSIDDIKDLIRGSIVMENDEDLLYMMHYFVRFLIKNGDNKFYNNISNESIKSFYDENGKFNPEKLQIKLSDKGILSTALLDILPKGIEPKDKDKNLKLNELNDDQLNWVILQILKEASKTQDRKETNSKHYRDSKFLVPAKVVSNSIPNYVPVELKFLTKKDMENNEFGVSNHNIMRFKQDIILLCRDRKYITSDEIKEIIAINLLNYEDIGVKKEITIEENKRKPKNHPEPRKIRASELLYKISNIKQDKLPEGLIVKYEGEGIDIEKVGKQQVTVSIKIGDEIFKKNIIAEVSKVKDKIKIKLEESESLFDFKLKKEIDMTKIYNKNGNSIAKEIRKITNYINENTNYDYSTAADIRNQIIGRLKNQLRNILEAKNLFDINELPEGVKVEYKDGKGIDVQKKGIQEITIKVTLPNMEQRKIHLNVTVDGDKIKIEEKKTIKEEILKQVKNDDKTPENVIYDEVIKNLVPIKFSYKGKKPEPIAFCDKDLIERLNNNDFIFDFLGEDERVQELKLKLKQRDRKGSGKTIFQEDKKTSIKNFLKENDHIKTRLENFGKRIKGKYAEDKLLYYLKKKIVKVKRKN